MEETPKHTHSIWENSRLYNIHKCIYGIASGTINSRARVVTIMRFCYIAFTFANEWGGNHVFLYATTRRMYVYNIIIYGTPLHMWCDVVVVCVFIAAQWSMRNELEEPVFLLIWTGTHHRACRRNYTWCRVFLGSFTCEHILYIHLDKVYNAVVFE